MMPGMHEIFRSVVVSRELSKRSSKLSGPVAAAQDLTCESRDALPEPSRLEQGSQGTR